MAGRRLGSGVPPRARGARRPVRAWCRDRRFPCIERRTRGGRCPAACRHENARDASRDQTLAPGTTGRDHRAARASRAHRRTESRRGPVPLQAWHVSDSLLIAKYGSPSRASASPSRVEWARKLPMGVLLIPPPARRVLECSCGSRRAPEACSPAVACRSRSTLHTTTVRRRTCQGLQPSVSRRCGASGLSLRAQDSRTPPIDAAAAVHRSPVASARRSTSTGRAATTSPRPIQLATGTETALPTIFQRTPSLAPTIGPSGAEILGASRPRACSAGRWPDPLRLRPAIRPEARRCRAWSRPSASA